MAMQEVMAENRRRLCSRLDEIGAPHQTVEHEAIFTVDEGRALKESLPGGHSKNLFLKDKKGQLFLVSAHCDTSIDLVQLGKILGAKGRFSFGKPELMAEVLAVEPGSVTPFALINAATRDLSSVVFDERFFEFDLVWFHPLVNTASTSIRPDDLVKFAKSCGYDPAIMSLPGKIDETKG